MSYAGCTCPRDGPKAIRTRGLKHLSALATLLLTRALASAGGQRPNRRHHRADHLTQRVPRILAGRGMAHCSCCLDAPAAARASRLAIRVHFFAWAARRRDCKAGAIAALGEINADATVRWGTRSYANATPCLREATPLSLTDADATERLLRLRNADATTHGPSPPEMLRRYEVGLESSVTRGTCMCRERPTGVRDLITES